MVAESVDAECGDGSDMMDDQAYYYPGAFVDPASGMYYVSGECDCWCYALRCRAGQPAG